MAHYCYIGLWYDCESSYLMSYEGLLQMLAEKKRMDEYAMNDPLYSQILEPWKWKLEDYLDGRKNVNMIRFRFCPDCGKRIDWKAMRMGVKA